MPRKRRIPVTAFVALALLVGSGVAPAAKAKPADERWTLPNRLRVIAVPATTLDSVVVTLVFRATRG